jgi:hypothetical protein
MRTASGFRRSAMSSAVALILVLGSGAAQAFEVQFEGSNATGILNLDINGTMYDVTFEFNSAASIYGLPPGAFDMADELEAGDAVDAVNGALNTENQVQTVGPDTSRAYDIGYDFENSIVWVRQATYGSATWTQLTGVLFESKAEGRTYARFHVSVPVEYSSWGQIKALYEK